MIGFGDDAALQHHGRGSGPESARAPSSTGVTNKVHLNMGWAGHANAYYDVTSDFAAGFYTWEAASQVIVIGVEPDYSQRETSPVLAPVYPLLLE